MNWFDIVLLVIFGLSIAAGVLKGFVQEVFALAGVVLGVVVALVFGESLGEYLEQWISLPSAAYAVAIIVLFVAVMVVVGSLSGILERILNAIQLGPVNRLLGGAFGVVRAFVISIVVVTALVLFLEPDHPVIMESKLTPLIIQGTDIIVPLLPEQFQEILQDRVI